MMKRAAPSFDPANFSANLWQAGRRDRARAVSPTGHPALDDTLADGGWPRAALSELLLPANGIGEMPLLLPALAGHAQGGGWIALLAPPFVPAIAAWQAAGIEPARILWLTPPDAQAWLWSAEQAARTAGCLLLAWPLRKTPVASRDLRRLQLAAQTGGGLAILLRDASARTQSSPAALRLALVPRQRGNVHVDILKQRGGFGGIGVNLPLHASLVPPRLAPWQLPVHLSHTTESGPARAVACHSFSVAADRPVGAVDIHANAFAYPGEH